MPLAEFLGAFGEIYRGIPYPNADRSILFESRLKANWKVIADAFAETYHIPAIHPETIGATFASNENPSRGRSARRHGGRTARYRLMAIPSTRRRPDRRWSACSTATSPPATCFRPPASTIPKCSGGIRRSTRPSRRAGRWT
ncbi:SRPBCC family protein [Novosphingobium resinovorum]